MESKPRYNKEWAESANQGGTAGNPVPVTSVTETGFMYSFFQFEEASRHDISGYHFKTTELLG